MSGSFLYSDYKLKTLEGQVVETGREGGKRRWAKQGEEVGGREGKGTGCGWSGGSAPSPSCSVNPYLGWLGFTCALTAPSPGSRTGCKHISPHLLLPEVWLGFQVILRRHALPASSSFWSLISNTFLGVAPAASLFRAPSQMHRGLFPCKHIFWDDTTALKSA